MKRIPVILLLILTCRAAHNEPVEQWGYVLHTANLSGRYWEETLPRYSVISSTGFTIQHEGALSYNADLLGRGGFALARKQGLTAYPLITFQNTAAGRSVLRSGTARGRAVDEIVSLIEKYDLPGVHLDFEYLPPEYSPKLGLFLEELKSRMRGRALSMAVFPQVGFPEEWSRFHRFDILSRGNLEEILPDCVQPSRIYEAIQLHLPHVERLLLSRHLDAVVLMCYDYHRAGTPPGPVTDRDWSERNVQFALVYFRPEQVWLGMPAYGYIWPEKGRGRAVSARYGSRLAAAWGSERHGSGTVKVAYTRYGKGYTLYFADRKTRELMTELASTYRLAGTALWRLGFEE